MSTDQIEDLDTLVRRAAARWGERTAWTFDTRGEQLTFRQVEAGVAQLAGRLAGLGIGRGDRVAVLLRNRPEFPLTWLALARLGAAMVPVNTNYRRHDAGHLLADSGACLLVTEPEFLDLADALLSAVPTLEQVLDVDSPAPGAEPVAGAVAAVPEDLANIQYTSGTTGRPKGCLLPHRYWTVLAESMVSEFPRLCEDDVMLTAQPFHYIDPQWNVAAALLSGAHLVVLDRFHPATFWERVRAHGVTYFYCLGLMPGLLLRMPPHPLDRHHRVRAVQASAIPGQLHRQLEERWGVPWYEAFGMTETGADLRVREDGHDAAVGTGCVGRPTARRDVRIVGPDDRPVPRGEQGEIALRGAGLMDGYLGRPEATAEAFRGGWFHTGDLGRMDELGNVYHLGRTKDMIRRSGENISATEVEEVLQLHPAVHTAAVVAVPDELRGEEVKAYLVGDPVEPEELAAHCLEQMAYFKVPRYWEFREALPLTASERVAKGELLAADNLLAGSYDRVEKVWR
ncbi:AMP-binding protein [Streptomyces sp. A3M-1-3]|uniref:AMP-binding protein n=1 Tax=Streptomyces sp. A3M-1-3 TaxID=2962044 RepID=UPI0020B6F8D8|nr:AMP-binding protein [Streptomyces sp. A3M-1-3]MCP3818170.1 AMP-binding protein [Streptomyces sp. A3M-1-3]